MITRAGVHFLVRSFDDPTDGQAVKSRDLILLLLDCSLEPFTRFHFTPGHVTCTGLVLAPDGEKVLLVHHRRLSRWLLPGGHVDPADNEIWDTARREVIEETGAELLPEIVPPLAGVDVHGIPPKGNEPYHLHHDLIFAFRAASSDVCISPESRDVAWAAPGEFDRFALPESIRRAYLRTIARGYN
jgi:8-oxo-dGTP pyrophosphatase MutT (NUDIX family)